MVSSIAQAGGDAKLPYRFGMSKDQVRAEAACTPYVDVPSTGGLECQNFPLDQKRNISLVFENGGLSKIQLWFAESATRPAALKAIEELVTYLQKAHGELESANLDPQVQVTAATLLAALDSQNPTQRAKVQLKPRQSPANAFVFASIFHDPHYGYYVFLYYTPPQK
jgi:hypothetical protein